VSGARVDGGVSLLSKEIGTESEELYARPKREHPHGRSLFGLGPETRAVIILDASCPDQNRPLHTALG
jgi:hypothetical protein